MVTLDVEHFRVHSGEHFFASQSVSSLGAQTNDHIQLHFTTPGNGTLVHIFFVAKSGGEATFTFREAPTGGLTGAAGTLTAHDQFRGSPTASELTIQFGASPATGGTILHQEILGETTIFPGLLRGEIEWILSPGTTYSVRLNDTKNVTGTIRMVWYEDTGN